MKWGWLKSLWSAIWPVAVQVGAEKAVEKATKQKGNRHAAK